MAVYLVAVSSKGISSVALARQISVGQKTAWFLLQRIRQMMDQDKPILRGIVEADETYIGGNGRQRGQTSKRDGTADQPKGRGGSRKMMAVTAVERGGKARARKGMTHSGHIIVNALYAWLDREAVLVTDELSAYRWIGRKFRAHLRISHSRGKWVRRDPLATTPIRSSLSTLRSSARSEVFGIGSRSNMVTGISVSSRPGGISVSGGQWRGLIASSPALMVQRCRGGS